MRFRIMPTTLGALMLLSGPSAAHAAGGSCQFVLGFATLQSSLAGSVGGCLDNQTFQPNGDAIQHTTNGMLVWRKADNETAFTNGAETWINGPLGLQVRDNGQRFGWELQAEHAAGIADPAAPAIIPADPTQLVPLNNSDGDQNGSSGDSSGKQASGSTPGGPGSSDASLSTNSSPNGPSLSAGSGSGGATSGTSGSGKNTTSGSGSGSGSGSAGSGGSGSGDGSSGRDGSGSGY